MEHALSFLPSPQHSHGENVYTNTHSLWQPIWGRGIFGGALIAQSLLIAQHTVPRDLQVHSTHCTFISAANNNTPILYHVTKIPRGRKSATRLVEAQQSGNRVFIALISFFLHEEASSSGGNKKEKRKMLEHQVCIPLSLEGMKSKAPPSKHGELVHKRFLSRTCQADQGSLYECVRLSRDHQQEQRPENQRLQQWIRTRDPIGRNHQPRIAAEGFVPQNQNVHLAALAYMTDNYFIGTAARVHHGNRFNNKHAMERIISSLASHGGSSESELDELSGLRQEEAEENDRSDVAPTEERPNIEMMVSLDHTIYFHNQTIVKADEWMFSEMETPWTGDERGLVVQKIWTRHGVLVATCFQEGAIRLLQDRPRSKI